MLAPKEVRTFCPRCGKYTTHALSLYKKGKDRAMAWGARKHERRRRGYGGQKYPKQRRTAKTTKKQTLKLTCKECGRQRLRPGLRLRKLEIKR
ncbi:MAG: 50S ribosomal protein L44e [Nitrososphaerota archaeon]